MKKSTKWLIVGVIACIVVVLAVKAFIPKENKDLTQSSTSTQNSKQKQNVLYVRYVVIEPTELVDGINVSGSLIPNEEVNLSFETSGKITDIFFEEGSKVKKGDILAKINDAPLQAQLKKLEAQLKPTQDRLYRQKALFEKEAVSQEAFQEAEANLSKLEADIEEVKARLAQTELRAPFDGIIGLRQVSEGAYASPTTNVAVLTNTNKLKIEFNIPERYAGILKEGAELTFTVEGDSIQHSAAVYATNSRVNTDTRTFTVRAIYDNKDGKLVPGRYVDVSLNTRVFENALAVPSEAIISEMGIDKVYLYKGGKAMPVNITKGLRTESHSQVLTGLSVGDTVITSGTMQLRTGTSVVLKNN